MNTRLTQTLRLPSLLLAAALQVLPIARAALPAAQTATNLLAIVFRWAAGAAAALGGVQAVSGASTVITSPLKTNITQGVAWSMRLITSPQQATYWAATGLPPGIALTGKNGSSLWSIGGTPTTLGTYNVGLTAKSSASAGPSETTSATLVLTVTGSSASPPAITGPPSNQTINQGQNATFNVTATGTAPLTYYWRKGTTVVSSGSSASYTITGAQSSDTGNYSVIVSNSAGTATSSAATLTVNVPPAVSVPPADQTATVGKSATFSVTATGTAPLTYHWRKGTAVVASGSSASYNIPSVQAADAGSYSVIVSNSAGTATSASATLTVNVPPAITSQPANQNINQGQTATFSVIAVGTAPLTYYWRKGTTVVASGSSASYAIANAQTADAGSYSVVVSNVAGTVASSPAQLTVNLLATPPAITSQLTNLTVTAGQSATFNVVASGTAPLTYHWRKGTTMVSVSSNPSYAIASAQAADAGSYSVIVSNSAGTANSSIATLTVNPAPIAPAITSQPTDLTVNQGQNATFNVTATGTAPLTYYWRKGTTVLLVGGNPSFTISGAQAADAGGYSVIVSNAAGTAIGSAATLTVNIPPGISVQPANRTISVGQSATFNVTASGTAPLTYYWRKGAMVVFVGGNACTIPNAQAADAGSYSVVVSNIAGTATSSTVTLAVNPPPVVSSPSVRGQFNGLFYESTGVSRFSAGYVSIVTTDTGRFSGRMQSSLGRFSFRGQFESNGVATVTVNRRAPATPLVLQLLLDPGGDLNEITGTVSDGFWTADLMADRAVYDRRSNPAPQAGSYTLVFPGTPGATDRPAGHGYGTVNVDTAGRVRFSGALADGTRVSQSTVLSSLGQWPCFALPYSGRGLVLGWLTFADRTEDDLNGWVYWCRPPQPSSTLFGAGFEVETEVVGSKFTRPGRGQTVLSFTNGVVALADGGLTPPLTTAVVVSPNNRVSSPADPRFSLSVKTSTGMFTGRTLDLDTNRSLRFGGVVLQKQDAGYGFFVRNNQSGTVYLGH